MRQTLTRCLVVSSSPSWSDATLPPVSSGWFPAARSPLECSSDGSVARFRRFVTQSHWPLKVLTSSKRWSRHTYVLGPDTLKPFFRDLPSASQYLFGIKKVWVCSSRGNGNLCDRSAVIFQHPLCQQNQNQPEYPHIWHFVFLKSESVCEQKMAPLQRRAADKVSGLVSGSEISRQLPHYCQLWWSSNNKKKKASGEKMIVWKNESHESAICWSSAQKSAIKINLLTPRSA